MYRNHVRVSEFLIRSGCDELYDYYTRAFDIHVIGRVYTYMRYGVRVRACVLCDQMNKFLELDYAVASSRTKFEKRKC